LLALSDYELTFKGPEDRALDLFAKFDRDKNQVLEKREYQGKIPSKLIPLLQSQAGAIDIESVQNFFRANRNYYSLESSQMLVSPNLAKKADDLIQEMGLQSSQIMVYLANNIQEKNNAVPYSVIAGIDATLQKKLGVKLTENEKSGEKIWLLEWNDSPLKPAIGDPVGIEYFLPEVVGKPIEKKDSFQFAGYIPADINLVDPEITPDFP
jgi:hypothetical protein